MKSQFPINDKWTTRVSQSAHQDTNVRLNWLIQKEGRRINQSMQHCNGRVSLWCLWIYHCERPRGVSRRCRRRNCWDLLEVVRNPDGDNKDASFVGSDNSSVVWHCLCWWRHASSRPLLPRHLSSTKSDTESHWAIFLRVSMRRAPLRILRCAKSGDIRWWRFSWRWPYSRQWNPGNSWLRWIRLGQTIVRAVPRDSSRIPWVMASTSLRSLISYYDFVA